MSFTLTPRKVLLDQGGEIEADIATADDDGAAGFQFFVAKAIMARETWLLSTTK